MQPHTGPDVPEPAEVSAPDGPPARHLAVVTEAEAIAAGAAAVVVTDAAATAQAAVEAASAAAIKAAVKASAVAAEATRVACAAPTLSAGEQAQARAAAEAATKVAACVTAIAAAAAAAARDASTMILQQLALDVAATAAAVSLASVTNGTTPRGGGSQELLPQGPVRAEELRAAIADNQLRLHYQPIIDLLTGQPVGVESLVRWQHPVRGLLLPTEFVPLAERSDLVLLLGDWVMREACRAAVLLEARSGPPLTVAINLSGRQLSDSSLVAVVRAALVETGCRASSLVFEVTETALVTDMPLAIASMQELQGLGAGVAIDDFGTGYSSLLYLKHLAAQDLKIDRSFVSGLAVESYDTAVVASLIVLAHNLDVRCIAEGVETPEQCALLRQLGCDFAQGYLFSRPVDLAALEVWLDRHPELELAHGGVEGVSAATARILEMHQNDVSVHTIAAALNAGGSRTSEGRRWSGQSVTRSLADLPRQ